MKPKILLVNPAIYDFAAYDFWLKPYGMLSVAGQLRGKANFEIFDYLDREHSFARDKQQGNADEWGRGGFYSEPIAVPKVLEDIPRHFRRYGLPRKIFADFLQEERFDYVFIQTMMSYWYPGVQEVIEDVRRCQPKAKIIAGGNYVTICHEHAKSLGADFLLAGVELEPLWEYLGIEADSEQPGLWEIYPTLKTGVLKLTEGCPFKCTYCCVPKVYGRFKVRSVGRSLAEVELLCELGVKNIAFYDDALLFDAGAGLVPFLNEVLKRNINVNFHSPNALNARFVTKGLAELMVRAGFKTFYLGFESGSAQWQKRTGSKVLSQELADAVECLTAGGAEKQNITAYEILGHPHIEAQQLEESMRFVHGLGIRGMLADFSPIPGTIDGEYCRKWVDMDEPLMHNKTAFAITSVGFDENNRLKDLQRQLNREIA
ncbi:MAG: radical SAM protein [Planctomycetes bacterium]|nr:radical SAM protein [Planctomycetota bacterium]